MIRVDVLGVDIDPLTMGELNDEVLRLSRQDGCSAVLNVNAHCLNLLRKDERLRRFFRQAEIVFSDGAGVVLGARILGRRIPGRITYADWLPSLAVLAETENLSLFFLGSRPGVAEEAARKLTKQHPRLTISGALDGYFDHRSDSSDNERILRTINAASPDILLLGMGMPLQERWLMENRERLNVRVALTGGAVFDYVAGELRRGPKILTDNGFEWLARLAIEPRRLWRRYLIGNPTFLFRVLRQRLQEMRSSKT
ncbi:MAG: WecB/TagA/CpsF family glycosyltransferase [Actinomycetota bacterium]|nr:WecB/TagA/CpsF family glycosyltransferase [Actinomycetota bacterium]